MGFIEFDKKWFDKYGNLKANSEQATSENPSTINAVFAFLLEINHLVAFVVDNEQDKPIKKKFFITALNWAKHGTNNGKYMTMEFDHAKHEEVKRNSNLIQRIVIFLRLDIYSKIAKFFSLPRSSDRFSHDELNAISSSSYYFADSENLEKIPSCSVSTWYRFYDVLRGVSYAKNGGRFNRWCILFFAKIACKDTSKDHRGKYHASGKQQVFIRLWGLRLSTEFMDCTKLLPEKGKWGEVFDNYYVENDHPIRVLSRRILW